MSFRKAKKKVLVWSRYADKVPKDSLLSNGANKAMLNYCRAFNRRLIIRRLKAEDPSIDVLPETYKELEDFKNELARHNTSYDQSIIELAVGREIWNQAETA